MTEQPERRPFRLEEATIDELHAAIQAGETNCVAVVRQYIERARAYNGVASRLVTEDGRPIPEAEQLRYQKGDPCCGADAGSDQRKGPSSISQQSGLAGWRWGRNPGEEGCGGREVSQQSARIHGGDGNPRDTTTEGNAMADPVADLDEIRALLAHLPGPDL